MLTAVWIGCLSGLGAPAGAEDSEAPLPLDQQLLEEDPSQLAREAREHGDPRRGAVVFHLPQATCTKCHTAGQGQSPLGPDLARPAEGTTDRQLVEAVLAPSRRIRQGFEPLVIVLDDGTSLTGLLVEERPDALVVRDVAEAGRIREIPRERIDEHAVGRESIMPAGLANLVGGRRQFLDLAAYLIEIAEHGPERALELAPPPRAPDTSGTTLQVYRTMMPQSGPASLAVGLGEGIWICFDPQRGGVNYAWSGALDLAPTVAQKINQPAGVEGRLFYRDNVDRPLRPGDPDRLPALRFRGYRFVDDAVEIEYQVDALRVRERLARLPDGSGFVRTLRLEGEAATVWIRAEEQPSALVEVEPGTREEGGWRFDLAGPQPMTVRMTVRAKEPTDSTTP